MPDNEMTPDKFHGLTGKVKQYASLGVIGCLALMCMHLVLIQNPSMHATHLKTLPT